MIQKIQCLQKQNKLHSYNSTNIQKPELINILILHQKRIFSHKNHVMQKPRLN